MELTVLVIYIFFKNKLLMFVQNFYQKTLFKVNFETKIFMYFYDLLFNLNDIYIIYINLILIIN